MTRQVRMVWEDDHGDKHDLGPATMGDDGSFTAHLRDLPAVQAGEDFTMAWSYQTEPDLIGSLERVTGEHYHPAREWTVSYQPGTRPTEPDVP